MSRTDVPIARALIGGRRRVGVEGERRRTFLRAGLERGNRQSVRMVQVARASIKRLLDSRDDLRAA